MDNLATFHDLGSVRTPPDDANRLRAFIALKTTPTTTVKELTSRAARRTPRDTRGLGAGDGPRQPDEIVLPTISRARSWAREA